MFEQMSLFGDIAVAMGVWRASYSDWRHTRTRLWDTRSR